jgi:hypothetical protein
MTPSQLHASPYSLLRRSLLALPGVDRLLYQPLVAPLCRVSPLHAMALVQHLSALTGLLPAYLDTVAAKATVQTTAGLASSLLRAAPVHAFATLDRTDSDELEAAEAAPAPLAGLAARVDGWLQGVAPDRLLVTELLGGLVRNRLYGAALHVTDCAIADGVLENAWTAVGLTIDVTQDDPFTAVARVRHALHALAMRYWASGERPEEDLLVICGSEQHPNLRVQEALEFACGNFAAEPLELRPVLRNGAHTGTMTFPRESLDAFVTGYDSDGACRRAMASKHLAIRVHAAVNARTLASLVHAADATTALPLNAMGNLAHFPPEDAQQDLAHSLTPAQALAFAVPNPRPGPTIGPSIPRAHPAVEGHALPSTVAHVWWAQRDARPRSEPAGSECTPLHLAVYKLFQQLPGSHDPTSPPGQAPPKFARKTVESAPRPRAPPRKRPVSK